MIDDRDDPIKNNKESALNISKLLENSTNPHQETDKMGVFHKNLALIKRFMCFIQSMDQWVYNQPETHISERPEPISLEQAHQLAVDFAKTQRDD